MAGTSISSPAAVVKGRSEVAFGSNGVLQAEAKYNELSRLKVLLGSYSAGASLILPPVFLFTQASMAGFVAPSSLKSTG